MKSNKKSSQNRKRSNNSNQRRNNKKSNSSSKEPEDRFNYEMSKEFGINIDTDVSSKKNRGNNNYFINI